MTRRVGENGQPKKNTGTSLPDSGAEREAKWVRQLLSAQPLSISGVIHDVLYVANEPVHADKSSSWMRQEAGYWVVEYDNPRVMMSC